MTKSLKGQSRSSWDICIMYLYYVFLVYLMTKVVKEVILINKYSPLLQFASSGFYQKAIAPSRWVAPPVGEDSDVEVEAESDVDDSDLDPDYVVEEDMTPTTSGENKINLYLLNPRNQDAILV